MKSVTLVLLDFHSAETRPEPHQIHLKIKKTPHITITPGQQTSSANYSTSKRRSYQIITFIFAARGAGFKSQRQESITTFGFILYSILQRLFTCASPPPARAVSLGQMQIDQKTRTKITFLIGNCHYYYYRHT